MGKRATPNGNITVFKNPADRLAPYRAVMTMPDGRKYEGRLRSHPTADPDQYWYEGFVSAVDPIDFARDELLKRYPDLPDCAPASDLWPCQIKINPFPPRKAKPLSPDLIGTVWVSHPASKGGAFFTILALYQRDPNVVFEGNVLPYEPPAEHR
jgi:hypothetical protein